MDTTSHNFTWQSWTFGEHSSSVLYDVAIIDENNIWAVGEIYMKDSIGNPDPIAYNAIHWDGIFWKAKKISVLFKGNIITPTLEGVFAFSGNDIWFVGSLPIHGDGVNWMMYDLRTTVNPNISLSRAWGLSSNDIYFVGRAGNIAHYDGTKWTKIESGTSLDFQDIYGDFNYSKTNNEILAIASNLYSNMGRTVCKIETGKVVSLLSDGLSAYFSSIWFVSRRLYYIVGLGIYKKGNLNEPLWNRFPLGVINNYYSYCVKGNSFNNVIIVGSFGEVVHFNGVSWNKYNQTYNLGCEYNRVSIKNNSAVFVGYENNKALITKCTN
jgi:hypothetical protein